jgi:hypothetical protein
MKFDATQAGSLTRWVRLVEEWDDGLHVSLCS